MKISNTKKIQVSFNQINYETNHASLLSNIDKILNCLSSIEKITGKREWVTIEVIEKAITDKSNFANIELSAALLKVETEYSFLKHNLNKVNLDVVDFIDGVPHTKKDVLERIKEANTTYLLDRFINEYEVLEKACAILNKLETPNSVNNLKQDTNGKYSINLQRMNDSARM
mgnify:CR=1 FL=1